MYLGFTMLYCLMLVFYDILDKIVLHIGTKMFQKYQTSLIEMSLVQTIRISIICKNSLLLKT